MVLVLGVKLSQHDEAKEAEVWCRRIHQHPCRGCLEGTDAAAVHIIGTCFGNLMPKAAPYHMSVMGSFVFGVRVWGGVTETLL